MPDPSRSRPAPRHAVPLIGLAVCAVGLATTIPLPLYGAYAAAGGHGAGALALAFAAYAGTLILTAPVLGPLPDRIGRRRCVLIGVALAALSTLMLALVPGIPALAVARVAQGLGMGCVAGAAAAWAAELAGGTVEGARRAAAVLAAATIGSFGVGGVLTLGAVLAWPWMAPPVTFPAHLAFCVLMLLAVARLPETLVAPARGGWIRRLAFPGGTLAATLAIVPGWGTTGTMLTSVQAAMTAEGLPLAGPAAGCAMMLVGVLAQQVVRGLVPRRAVRAGLFILLAGSGLAFWGAAAGAVWPLLGGAVVVGVGVYAFIYAGGRAAVAEAATGEERARAVAGYFLVAHIGFSAVPLAVGLAVDAVGTAPALAGLWVVSALAAAGLAAALSARSG